MMYEESIYKLIPPQSVPMMREKRYKSKHNPEMPPTSTTFGLGTTSKSGLGNIAGETVQEIEPHSRRAMGATFGKAKGALKPDVNNFTKKATGRMGSMKLPEAQKYNRSGGKKPAIPGKDDTPIMGLVSDKNYIVANAVENILAAPKVTSGQGKDYLKKPDFGKTPNYLNTIKNEINEEYDLVKAMQDEEEAEREKDKMLLPEDERKELLDALKKKWEVVHKQYQELTHITKIDTIGLRNRKEGCEVQLAQLEKDIAKLEKTHIFVQTTYY